ncbi:MAG: hypothetical protein JWM87_758 [Candidatus Eremiobacteraeota bacterium]|nr:hypothetical protein [Candidatus Eremiobacteraeota bacterium]
MMFPRQRLSPSERRRWRKFLIGMADLNDSLSRSTALMVAAANARLARVGPPLRWTDGANQRRPKL